MGRTRKEPVDFNTFWDAYALKLDRKSAERAWLRLSDKDRRAAMAGIDAYREDCRRRGIPMMYAQGYLNHRRWEDERPVINNTTAVAATDGGTPAVPASKECDVDDMEQW